MKGYEYFHKPLQTLYNIVRKSYIWLHLQSLIQEEFCACILEIIYVEHVFQHILIDYLFIYLQDLRSSSEHKLTYFFYEIWEISDPA